MEHTNNYKCPACGGGLRFDPKTGKVICEYCDSSYTNEEIEKIYGKKDEQNDSKPQNQSEESDSEWGEDGNKMREYSCPSCGAVIICEATTAATQCPYCDNPAVIEKQFKGDLKPDYCLPFSVEKKKAISLLKECYKGKKLLPREFSDENHLEEVKGIYVPFWFFSGTAEGSFTFKATTSTSSRSSKSTTITTKHYMCNRKGSLKFNMIPADASNKMPDDVMDSLEPFDFSKLKDFSTAYLPGYFADKYDVSADECEKRAIKRSESTFEDAVEDSVQGFESVSLANKNIKFKRESVKYGLVPVWILYTKYHGERKLFAINGQSGKLVGKLPVGKREAFLYNLRNLLISAVVDAALIFAAFQIF